MGGGIFLTSCFSLVLKNKDVRYFFQRIFSKQQLSKDIFGNFPNVQFPKLQLPKSILVTVLGITACYSRCAWHPSPSLAERSAHHCILLRLRVANLTSGMLPLGKLHIWEVATWENVMVQDLTPKCFINKAAGVSQIWFHIW